VKAAQHRELLQDREAPQRNEPPWSAGRIRDGAATISIAARPAGLATETEPAGNFARSKVLEENLATA